VPSSARGEGFRKRSRLWQGTKARGCARRDDLSKRLPVHFAQPTKTSFSSTAAFTINPKKQLGVKMTDSQDDSELCAVRNLDNREITIFTEVDAAVRFAQGRAFPKVVGSLEDVLFNS